LTEIKIIYAGFTNPLVGPYRTPHSAVQSALDYERAFDSPWAAIDVMSEKIDCTAEMLRKGGAPTGQGGGIPPGPERRGGERNSLDDAAATARCQVITVPVQPPWMPFAPHPTFFQPSPQ